MCGIAGIVSDEPTTEEQMQLHIAEMKHRGPDSSGTLQSGHATLGFQRLAILDLTPHGNQPMCNETGEIWVVFNGEIYNFEGLRDQLKSSHRFESRSDTEVLVHGYEQWGFEGLLSRIDGMFAFAIWDGRTQELLFARDRVGKKPLFYAQRGQNFHFASTLNVLLSMLPQRPSVNHGALDQYLTYHAVPAPETIWTNVFSLPPAHFGRWSSTDGLKIARYWDLSYADKKVRTEAALLDELEQILLEATRQRLISDVPLGAFLSGGVDSSLIVGMMSRLGTNAVEAVNIGFEDARYDERQYARTVARHCGAKLHETVLTSDEIGHLPEIVWHFGQPLADVSVIPTFAVAREARKLVTVALNGDGGDEAFAGYARPIVMKAAADVRRTFGPLSPIVGRLASMAGRRGGMLAEALNGTPEEQFRYTRGLSAVRRDLYAPGFAACIDGLPHPDCLYQEAWRRADGRTDVDRALYGDLTTYLPDQLLTKMDVATMASSLEARSPLLDRRVLEFAASIPVPQLIQKYRTKILLKRLAARYVPAEVIFRRKRGFVMPTAEWLRGSWSPVMHSLLSADTIRARGIFQPEPVQQMVRQHLAGADWSHVIWTIMVLELWFQIYVDRSITRHTQLS